MQLTGLRIKLAPLDASDLDLFIEMSMSSVTMEHICDPYSFEAANEAFNTKLIPWTIESDGWLSFGISEKFTGEKLESIGLKIINHEAQIAEVDFMIKLGAQGKGFATESLNLIRNFAFTKLQLSKLVATCSIENTSSYKLLE